MEFFDVKFFNTAVPTHHGAYFSLQNAPKRFGGRALPDPLGEPTAFPQILLLASSGGALRKEKNERRWMKGGRNGIRGRKRGREERREGMRGNGHPQFLRRGCSLRTIMLRFCCILLLYSVSDASACPAYSTTGIGCTCIITIGSHDIRRDCHVKRLSFRECFHRQLSQPANHQRNLEGRRSSSASGTTSRCGSCQKTVRAHEWLVISF